MLQALNKPQTSFEDGYLTLFDDQYQAGVKAGISRAREVKIIHLLLLVMKKALFVLQGSTAGGLFVSN